MPGWMRSTSCQRNMKREDITLQQLLLRTGDKIRLPLCSGRIVRCETNPQFFQIAGNSGSRITHTRNADLLLLQVLFCHFCPMMQSSDYIFRHCIGVAACRSGEVDTQTLQVGDVYMIIPCGGSSNEFKISRSEEHTSEL